MKYGNIREEELKNKIAEDYFEIYDCTKIVGNIDFCVSVPKNPQTVAAQESLLWAEAKKGVSDVYKSIVQLILTIGKARTFDSTLPPAMLGAFDAERIAFVPYSDIYDIFYINDFNWNVAPSNHGSKEFKLLHERVQKIIADKALLFDYLKDDSELRQFVKNNFVVGKSGWTKTRIDKNNFITIYNKWVQNVKPTIAVKWEIAQKKGIIDGDFYLADLLSQENQTLREKLFVLLKRDHYEFDRDLDDAGIFSSKQTSFLDKQVAHTQFWNRYERPPREEYWDYIVERRDLLVPQDVRERKGSFFTPQIWVELSQRYLTDTFGEDWQDEYYIWDCAAGTGNLLTGLTNKYHIWASTLDKQDVEVMRDRIKNGANLLEDHVFQFDFLNDDFSKLPKTLQSVINDPKKRKKLVVYINPPYAEGNGRISITRSNVHESRIFTKYNSLMGKVGVELFAQFLMRIYTEIPDCFIAQFSTLKVISATNSKTFRNHFKAKLEKLFVVPADTFDNVNGKFPIGFFIWDTKTKEAFIEKEAAVFDTNGNHIGQKYFYAYDTEKSKINDWLDGFRNGNNGYKGVLVADAPDFQNSNFVCIQNVKGQRHGKYFMICQNNFIYPCVYFAVRRCIAATWLNDRDQFLYPADEWKKDKEFQSDCLAFTLFHGQNRISNAEGINHWIPFTEYEVDAREKFESNFMTRYIKGKIKNEGNGELFGEESQRNEPLVFSAEAAVVFAAGRELWKYYHRQPNCNVNASLYDIRAHFQGRNDKKRMNNKSEDENYNLLIANLRDSLKVLAKKIEPKVYLYGFLKA